jgi:hypothetical protein
VHGVIKLMETESGILVIRGQEGENGELFFNEY